MTEKVTKVKRSQKTLQVLRRVLLRVRCLLLLLAVNNNSDDDDGGGGDGYADMTTPIIVSSVVGAVAFIVLICLLQFIR